MISLQQQSQLMLSFRIFDYEKIKLELENLAITKLSPILQKQQLLIWTAFLAQELLNAEITLSAVDSLFNRSLDKIETLSPKEYHKYAPLLFHEYMLVLQQYRRFTHNKRVNDMITCMLVNLHEVISLEDVAFAGDISEEYAIALFRKHTKYSPIEFYYRLKIERAQFLLVNTSHPITYISTLLCFSDQSHFTKRFKQITGMTPLKYRSIISTAPAHLVQLI